MADIACGPIILATISERSVSEYSILPQLHAPDSCCSNYPATTLTQGGAVDSHIHQNSATASKYDNKQPDVQLDRAKDQGAQVSNAIVLAGITSSFLPTAKMKGGDWDELLYSTGSWQYPRVTTLRRPSVKVTRLLKGQGNDVIAEVTDASRAGWKLCARFYDVASKQYETREYSAAAGQDIVSVKMSPSFMLEKGAPVYLASLKPGQPCTQQEDWTLTTTTVAEVPPGPDDKKKIGLKSLLATLESDGIMVRLELDLEKDAPVIEINGTKVAPRKKELKRKGKKVVGVILYASLPQKLRRKEDFDRRVHVDVSADGYETLSLETRATW